MPVMTTRTHFRIHTLLLINSCNVNGTWGTRLDAEIAERTLILVFLNNDRVVGFLSENIHGANPDALAAFFDPDTFLEINFHSNKFAHDCPSF